VEDSGVWDQHLELHFDPAEGIVLSAQPNALAAVNGEAVQQTVLRNGDAIDIGSLRLQFWLSETRQADLRLREGFTWAAIAAISLGQVGLIYWLLR
jgi:hypothetical protein